MLGLRWIFAIVLLSAVLHLQGCADKEPAYYDSLRLVSAMREDEMMLLAARSAKSQQDKLSAQDLECLDRLEYPEITDVAALQISEKLSADEVQDALSYFQSPGGRKLVRRTELELNGEAAGGAQDLSAAEQAELEQFKQRSAGRKLLRDLVLREAERMEEVTARVDRHLAECEYMRRADTQGPTSCKSKSIASQDNVCLATYVAEADVGSTPRASVEIECRHHERMLTSQIGIPNPEWPIALRWSGARELEILIDNNKVRISHSTPPGSSQRFRFASRQPTDPPVLECLPVTNSRPTLATTFPLSITVGAWRTYRKPGLCLMTARVPKEDVVGADGDMLLQFRRQKRAALPFATADLALVVHIHQLKNERPLLLNSGRSPLAMIDQGSQQTHMLAGEAADALLQDLKSKPAELTVQPEGAASYSIPLRRQDFDFAYADFAACLAELKAT